jgi:hypothetical protein|nr:MAG TPA: hypothetical protein [Caudoviricetes sp.]
MKVIYDEKGDIFYQMMDTAPDPVGGLRFDMVDVPPGRLLVKFDMSDGTAKPVFIDRPLTQEEQLAKEIEELKSKQQTTDLALVELSANLMS